MPPRRAKGKGKGKGKPQTKAASTPKAPKIPKATPTQPTRRSTRIAARAEQTQAATQQVQPTQQAAIPVLQPVAIARSSRARGRLKKGDSNETKQLAAQTVAAQQYQTISSSPTAVNGDNTSVTTSAQLPDAIAPRASAESNTARNSISAFPTPVGTCLKRNPTSILRNGKGVDRRRQVQVDNDYNHGPRPAVETLASTVSTKLKRPAAPVNEGIPKAKKPKSRHRMRNRSPNGMSRLRVPYRALASWNPPAGTIKDFGDLCIYCSIQGRKAQLRCARCRELLYCSDYCRQTDKECHMLICHKWRNFVENNDPPTKHYYRAIYLPTLPGDKCRTEPLSPVELVWVKIARKWDNDDRILIDIVHHELVEDEDSEMVTVDLLAEPTGPYPSDMSDLPGTSEVVLNTSRALCNWPIGHGVSMISFDGSPYKPVLEAGYKPDRASDPAFSDDMDQANTWTGELNTFMAKLHLPGAMYIERGPRIIFSFVPISGGPALVDLSLRDFRYVVDYFRNNPKNPRLNEPERCSHTDTGLPALQIMDLKHSMTKRLGIEQEFHRIVAPQKSCWDAGIKYCLIPYFLGLPWIFRPGPLTAKSTAYGNLGSLEQADTRGSDGGDSGHRSTLIPLTYILHPIFNDDPQQPTHWVVTRDIRHESGVLMHAYNRPIEPIHVQALVEYFYRKIVEPQIKTPDDSTAGLWLSRDHFQAFWLEFLHENGLDAESAPDPWEGTGENSAADDGSGTYHHNREVRAEIEKREFKLWFHQPVDPGGCHVPGIGKFGPLIDHPGDLLGDIDFQTWSKLKPPGSEAMQQNEQDRLWHYDRERVENEKEQHRVNLQENPTTPLSPGMEYDDPLDGPAFGSRKGIFFYGKITIQEEDSSSQGSLSYDD